MAGNQANITIQENDVLCGRGGFSNNHPGNKLFRCIIRENKELYHELSENTTRKHMLVSSIIKAIQHHGGRFLRKSEGKWVEISHKAACSKTSQALREQDSAGNNSLDANIGYRSPSPLHSKFRQALQKQNDRNGKMDDQSPQSQCANSILSKCESDSDVPELTDDIQALDDLIGDLEATIEGTGSSFFHLISDGFSWENGSVLVQ